MAKYLGAMLDEYCDYNIGENEIPRIEINGKQYFISDIGLRILTPRELFNANGFPSDYIIDVDSQGKKLSKATQVAKCGNEVPPLFAEALVLANLPELCTFRRLYRRYVYDYRISIPKCVSGITDQKKYWNK